MAELVVDEVGVFLPGAKMAEVPKVLRKVSCILNAVHCVLTYTVIAADLAGVDLRCAGLWEMGLAAENVTVRIEAYIGPVVGSGLILTDQL